MPTADPQKWEAVQDADGHPRWRCRICKDGRLRPLNRITAHEKTIYHNRLAEYLASGTTASRAEPSPARSLELLQGVTDVALRNLLRCFLPEETISAGDLPAKSLPQSPT